MEVRLCFACAVRVLNAAREEKINILDPEALSSFITDQFRTGELIRGEMALHPGIGLNVVIPLKGQSYCAFHLELERQRRRQLPPYSPPDV